MKATGHLGDPMQVRFGHLADLGAQAANICLWAKPRSRIRLLMSANDAKLTFSVADELLSPTLQV